LGPSYVNLASSHWIIENSVQENPPMLNLGVQLISVSCVVYWSSTSCCFIHDVNRLLYTKILVAWHGKIGENKYKFTKFQPENYGFDDLYTKDFSQTKSPKFARFLNQKISNFQIFMISSSR
jgi:hypothetical protein